MKAFVPIILLTVSAWAVGAEQPQVLVELERERIYEGDSVLYRVTLSHVENPTAPNLDGFDDFLVQPRGEQSLDSEQITIINGQMTRVVTRGRAYDYLLTPRRAGKLIVPAPTAQVAGRVLRGESLELTVIAPQDQDVVLLELQVDKPAVYPTQKFTVTLVVAVKGLPEPFAQRDPVALLSRPPALSIPWVDDDALPAGVQPEQPRKSWLQDLLVRRGSGFSINNLGRSSGFSLFDDGPLAFLPKPQTTRREDRRSHPVTYWEYAFPRSFTAQQVGELTFGPVTLKGTLATRVSTRGQLEGETLFAATKPVKLVVKDVPQAGRPDSYTGAIGEFEFAGQLAPTVAKVGDPLTLTLTVRGRGTLDAIRAPDLGRLPEVAEQFKVYEATEESAPGERRFTYSLRPLKPGAQTFPAVPLTYFDVAREQFRTLQTDPLSLQVTAAEQLQGQQVAVAGAAAPTGRDVETQEGGIFANDLDLISLRDDSVQPGRWFLGLGLAAGLYGVAAVVTRRWQRLSGDPDLRRRRTAANRARQRLATVPAGSGREAADAWQAAVVGLVADAAGLPEAGLTSAEVQQHLRQMQIDEPLVARVSAWFEACDAARYGARSEGPLGAPDSGRGLLEELLTALRQKRLVS